MGRGSEAFLNVLLIFNGALAVYSIRIKGHFVADDHSIFYRLQQGGAFGFATYPPTSFFRPLISLHYYLDYTLWGMSPLASHAVNLVWHIVCGLLVWLLAQRVLARWGWLRAPAQGAAIRAALLFVVLPANVEAVAWFAARADMVATAGALGALLLLMRFQEQGCRRSYAGALACFAVGLFCKESLLTFPLIAWLWLRHLGAAQAGRLTLPFWGVLVVYWAMRTAVVQGLGAYPDAWATLQRPWLLGVNLLAYLFQMGMPAILYGLGRDLWDTLLWGGWLVGVSLAGWHVQRTPRLRTRPVDWSLLVGLMLLALLPVLIFKPSPLYFLNSRYSYLASAFGVIGVVAMLMQFARPRRSPVLDTAAALLLLAYIFGGMRQAEAWGEAGAIARSSVLSLRDAPADKPLMILSLPDHFHGAYIWRAGFHEGVALLLPERASQPMYALSRFTMRLHTDGRVQYADGVATLSSPDDIFLPPEGVRTPPTSEPMVLPDKVVVPLSVLQQGVVLGYEKGKFVALTP
ncbi:MAG: hypothetical protein K6U77_00915 [Armatimonadetes bacterium]|nr:hypothetical protein [Armatimonadota bacterium]